MPPPPETLETLEAFVQITGLSLNATTTSSLSPSRHSLHGVKSCTGAVIGQKSFSDTDSFSELDVLNTQSPRLANQATIAAAITSDLYEPRGHTLFSSAGSLDNSETTLKYQSSSRDSLNTSRDPKEKTPPLQVPLKMTSIVEVRPSLDTAEIIEVEADHLEAPLRSQILPAKVALSLRSPSSPPPQFPAIEATKMAEQHQNFTVVRSGDIIEKNGTYYSSDGTVRGYSGTVRKIAQSKTLDDVFRKHKELEQQHEREYEIELQNKLQQQLNVQHSLEMAAKAASVQSQTKQVSQPPSTNPTKTNFRSSLG